ncbi:MAG: DUF6350 family protein [Bifidobacteriaceae bacterium]|jgi:hypothetical protein|nr:DUF6350 family protein [Bifidobacteriaceae bacterium]
MSQTTAVTPAVRRPPRGPAPSVAGLLVGIQAALLSWIVVVVPTVAAFTATSGMAANAGISWADAGRLGSAIWVLGHFGSLVLGDGGAQAQVWLSPLGIALVSVLACWAMSHSTTVRGWPLVAGGTLGFLMVDAVIAFVFARSAAGSPWLALVGGGGAALIGLAWSNRSGAGKLLAGRRAGGTDPGAPGAGGRAWLADAAAAWRGGAVMCALMIAAGGVLAGIAAIAGQARFRQVFGSLEPDGVGGVALVVLCLMLTPNAVAWGVAYLSGAGFAVGESTVFSPLATVAGPEPALPLFALVPNTSPSPVVIAVVAVPVLMGGLAGWGLGRRLRAAAWPWWRPGLAAIGAAWLAAGALTALAVMGSGAVGPGSMRDVGVAGWPMFGSLGLELCVGAALGAWVVGRPWRTRQALWMPDALSQSNASVANSEREATE